MARYEPIKFPGWRYGPNGEAQIFEHEEDVPQGWTDNPNDFKKDGVVDETGGTLAATNSPTATVETPLTEQELDEGLQKKSMSELWKMAKDLGIDKAGKKPELVARIKAKLQEAK